MVRKNVTLWKWNVRVEKAGYMVQFIYSILSAQATSAAGMKLLNEFR